MIYEHFFLALLGKIDYNEKYISKCILKIDSKLIF